jgi:phospholipid/cholesterol/gamma-HCH transport system ATP-binding protein
LRGISQRARNFPQGFGSKVGQSWRLREIFALRHRRYERCTQKIVMNMHANTAPPAVEFRHVCLSSGDRLVLNDISFALAQGEMIFLTGVSGSGKSVLLRVAMGLLKPDSGQVFIEGREIENLDESELIDIRGGLMGMVFQEDSLFTGLPAYENAAYRLEEHGWSEEEIDRAVREVLQFVGLEGEEEKFPEELSGGMKRRLEIARALIGWPRIMLFDEPTMSLDPLAAAKVLDLIIRARDINHISSLYVTKKIHEFDYLAHYCAEAAGDGQVRTVEASPAKLPATRVIVLESGKIVFDGSVNDFATSELPAIKELLTFDRHDHSHDPEFADPWDKRRRPAEAIL